MVLPYLIYMYIKPTGRINQSNECVKKDMENSFSAFDIFILN